jgi:hypothetical protein
MQRRVDFDDVLANSRELWRMTHVAEGSDGRQVFRAK